MKNKLKMIAIITIVLILVIIALSVVIGKSKIDSHQSKAPWQSESKASLTETIKYLSRIYTKPGTFKIIAEKPEWGADGTASVKIQIVGDLPEGANPQYCIDGTNDWKAYSDTKENILTGLKYKDAIAVKIYHAKTKVTQTSFIHIKDRIKPKPGAIPNVNTSFSTAYGKIDVIWLKGTESSTADVVSTPNAPELYSGENALKPVTWTYDETAKTWSEDTNAQSTWYNYSQGEGTQDNNSSMWANAKNTDGSYFVWIPRYAYRITYYENDPNTNTTQEPTGYYDGLGMWKAADRKFKKQIRRWNRNSRI